MSAAETTERRSSLQNAVLKQLHDPLRLRIILTAIVLAIGYWAVYTPLRDNIASTNRKLNETRSQLALAHEVEQLRSQFVDVQKRLPKQTDPKEWVQYMLKNIQKLPVTLKSLKCDPPRDLGPYKAVVFQMDITGELADLDQVLSWLEMNKRFFRADSITISAGGDKGNPILLMKLTILGIMG
jgi:Tfp pilus assembly protein PilO